MSIFIYMPIMQRITRLNSFGFQYYIIETVYKKGPCSITVGGVLHATCIMSANAVSGPSLPRKYFVPCTAIISPHLLAGALFFMYTTTVATPTRRNKSLRQFCFPASGHTCMQQSRINVAGKIVPVWC